MMFRQVTQQIFHPALLFVLQHLRERRLYCPVRQFCYFHPLHRRGFFEPHLSQFINTMPPRHLRHPGPEGARFIFLIQHCRAISKTLQPRRPQRLPDAERISGRPATHDDSESHRVCPVFPGTPESPRPVRDSVSIHPADSVFIVIAISSPFPTKLETPLASGLACDNSQTLVPSSVV